jgi:hypothetical protein
MKLDDIQYKIKEIINELENHELIEYKILDIINTTHFSNKEKLDSIRCLLEDEFFDEETCFKYIF